MPPDLTEYLQTLAERARAMLGDVLLGVYVTGSVALGAYEPGRSDVDVALVVRRGLSREEREALVAGLRHDVLPCPARGLELVVYRDRIAAGGGAEPGFELELNTGAGMPFRATLRPEDRPAADGSFWYVLDRSLLHDRGLTLFGPPADEVFADAPADAVRSALVAALRWWLGRSAPPGQQSQPAEGSDAVLNACRTLVRVRDGTWLAKVAAGRRAVELGLAPAWLVDQAVETRSGGPPLDAAAARAFQEDALRLLA